MALCFKSPVYLDNRKSQKPFPKKGSLHDGLGSMSVLTGQRCAMGISCKINARGVQALNLRPSMETPQSPNQNHLLAALPTSEFERIASDLQLVTMRLGDVLYESGGVLQHVYFPATAIVSLHYVTASGASAEIAGVGNEGVVGISLFMGGNSTPSRATVLTAGYGYRLQARLMMEEFNRSGVMMRLFLRYTQVFIAQISQTAVCNRHHSVEQQLARWLLTTLDRLSSNELTMTQELIAGMLGVRREGITEAAGHLQQAGYIRYRRGHISVLSRTGLESRVCECYAVVRKERNRLLGDVRHRQEPALTGRG
jgi:CRP-like cAMP-binding protein